MLYNGLYYRTEILKRILDFDFKKIALEIGIGMGVNLVLFSKKYKSIYGFDISKELITFLEEKIDIKNVHLRVVDLCSEIPAVFQSHFDTIFSSDVVEHLVCPQAFFINISRMLKKNGKATILFPNESRESHHGITWFECKEDLLKIIPQDLKIDIFEIRKTRYVEWAINFFWNGPKRFFKKALADTSKPQIFDETIAFSLNSKHPHLSTLLAFYAEVVLALLRIDLRFLRRYPVDVDIANKCLCIELVKR